MYPPKLRLVERGTPEPKQFVPSSATPPTTASAESEDRSLIMNILDGAIALTVQVLYALGAFRTRIARPAMTEEVATGTDIPWRGRGW